MNESRLDSFFALLREGGLPALVVLLFASAAAVTALVALILALSKAASARTVGVVAAAFCALVLVAGAAGLELGHRATERAAASLAESKDGEQIYDAQRVRHQGYRESQSCVKLAIDLAIVPLVVAIVALALTRNRGQGARAVRVAIGGVGIAAVVDLALLMAPLPPDPAPVDWPFVHAKEAVERGDLDGGCSALEAAQPSRIEPAFEGLAKRCVEHWIAEAGELEEPLEQKKALMQAWGSPLADEAHKQAITETVARLVVQKTSPRIKRLFVSGGLSRPEVKRELLIHFVALRTCYASLPSAATHPIDGTITASFTIDDKGKALKYSDLGSDVPSKPLMDCLSKTLRETVYPPTGLGFAEVEVVLEVSDPIR